jgi:hypothetical protein
MANSEENTIEIELETEDDNVKNDVPFDPNDININIIPRTIGQLVEMLEYNEILVPKYQRLPNLWSPKKKSRFIESLMLNLPIPLFYFDEGDDKKWRVIDGLQRMSTLEHFILGGQTKGRPISGNKSSFKLQDLEFRTEYNGKEWNELPRDIQRRIQTNQVTINLIGKGTPEQVKYNIFSRINQGGIELTPQEIRTALFQGYRLDLIESLVSVDTDQGKSFLKATSNSVPAKRQEDLDFATRFITFYLLDYKTYEPDMDTFMTTGTKEIPIDPPTQETISENFKKSMELSFSIFGFDAFRKRRRGEDRRMPINKALFEVVSVYFAKLSDSDRLKILNRKEDFITKFTALQNEDKFWSAITNSTASRESVKNRHEDFLKLLNQFKK